MNLTPSANSKYQREKHFYIKSQMARDKNGIINKAMGDRAVFPKQPQKL